MRAEWDAEGQPTNLAAAVADAIAWLDRIEQGGQIGRDQETREAARRCGEQLAFHASATLARVTQEASDGE